ncbi:MAG TPA: hypothetical protein VJL36_01435 [Candidatus Paceibacterota bacterium]
MISKVYFTLFAFSFSLFGWIQKVWAQGTIGTQPPGGSIDTGGVITNPLGSITDISALITKILEIVVQIGLPVIALAIVYTGFLFVKARGNESELTQAKTTLFWTVIGAAVILGAFVIQVTIQGTITELGK